MQDTLEQKVRHSQRKSFQYWYADGFTEIAIGLLFGILAAYFVLLAGTDATSWWRAVSALALPAVVVGGILGTRWLVGVLKRRYTYPRTGYVSYQRQSDKSNRGWRMVTAAIIGIAVATFFTSNPVALTWIPAVQGFAVGIVMFAIAARVNLLRFYVLAVVSVVLGVGISLRMADPNWGNAVFFAGMGVALLASGFSAFLVYLRQSRPAGLD